MTHLDLFSGIGGFSIAAQWAGIATVGFAETEPYCCALLYQHWPDIANYGDLRDADFSHLRGHITVLSAGVPCQPASLAGKRRGSKDDRWLWEATLDVVEVVRPDWTIFENPPGILSLDEFGGILLRLESFGYEIRLFSVPANAVGAKHRRERVFIVANSGCETLGERSGLCESEQERLWRRRSDNSDSQTLADPESGIRQWEASRNNGHATQCGQALADTDRLGSSGTDGNGQSIAKFLRVVNGVSPGLDQTTMPHPLTRERRIPNRSHRLKALGNAVVPQQVYPFFAAIAKTELGKGQ